MDLAGIAPEGIFSSADAGRVGLDANALRRLIRDGRCIRLTRGWFALHDGGPIDVRRRHVQKALALERQYAGRAAVSHHSRLLVTGLPTYAADPDTVHLTSVVAPTRTAVDGSEVRRNATVRRPGVTIHEPVAGARRWPAAGPHPPGAAPGVVPAACAIVQAGLVAGPEAFLVPADAAVRERQTTTEELGIVVRAFGGHRGIGPVRAVLPWVDARNESPGETRTSYLLRLLGFEVEPQLELIAEGRRYRADFRIRGTKVLVEFDGAIKYATGPRSLFAEKQREDALRRAGWVLVRIVWDDLRNPGAVRARILGALRIAA